MLDERKTLAMINDLERRYAHQLERPPHWLGMSIWDGWIPIVRALFERIDRELTPFELRRFRWSQIKQKWGQLRAYYHLDGQLARQHIDVMTPTDLIHVVSGRDDPLSTKVDEFIRNAAKQAADSCEMCGAPGKVVNCKGWVVVTCLAHESIWKP